VVVSAAQPSVLKDGGLHFSEWYFSSLAGTFFVRLDSVRLFFTCPKNGGYSSCPSVLL